MNRDLVIGVGTTLTAFGAGTQLVGSFATISSDPNVTTITAGNWNFENFVSMSSNGGTPKIYGEIYYRNLAGTETLIATNVVNPHPITSGTLNELYLWSIPVPATNVLATDRIVVKFYAIDLGGRTMTMHFEDSNIAQVITSLSPALQGATGATGVGSIGATGATGPAGTGTVTSVTATSPITSTGGATPVISTSMATNKLLGRSTASTGVAEEISIGTGLSLAGGTLSNTGVLSDTTAAQGGTQLLNMVQITSAAYSAIVTPTANTLYIIVG